MVRLGETRLEPVTITFGATVISDTLSLIVFAICVPIYQSGFSVSGLVVQLIEIAIVVPLILFGLSRLGAYILKKVEDDEDAYFILMLAIVAVAGLLAQSINLPGIVGAFLAGLAVNAAVHDKPLPQVAATLAATLVAFDTRNPAGQRLIDSRLLNVVLVLLLTTSILGPVLTEHFAPRLLKDATPPDRMKPAGTPDSPGVHREDKQKESWI